MKRVLQVFRDGHKRETPLTIPLLDAERGNMQTLAAMAKIVNEDRTQNDLRRYVLRHIVGRSTGRDPLAQLQKCFEYARDGIVYRRDPFGVERVADIWSTIYVLDEAGDCGVKATVFACMAALIGFKPFFVVIKQRPEQAAFNHVYCMVVTGDNSFQYYDPTPADKPAGWQAYAVERKLYPIL